MIQLTNVVAAWGRPNFAELLKQSIVKMGADELPLQAGLTTGSYALETPLNVMLINTVETDDCIHAKLGIFYKSLMPGCACAGDPTVEDKQEEHCTVLVSINKQTAEATFQLLEE